MRPATISREPWDVRAYRDRQAWPGQDGRPRLCPGARPRMGPAARRPRDREPARPQLRGRRGAPSSCSTNSTSSSFRRSTRTAATTRSSTSNGQRKNMTNHCGDPDSDRAGAIRASITTGTTTTARSSTAMTARRATAERAVRRPSELSEPENRNLDVAGRQLPEHPLLDEPHSSGNYFMWSPGAYRLPGRITLPRPTVGQEAFFWASSNRMLTEIKRS